MHSFVGSDIHGAFDSFCPGGDSVEVRSRGNQRQDVLMDEADRRRYLDLMSRHCQEHGVRILGYCQMTDHVHLIQ